MVLALCFATNFPLRTANSVENKADDIPKSIPNRNFNSVCMIRKIPIVTIKPKKSSYIMIFLLYKIGSMSEAKKAPVENIAKAMEILEAFMDAKKVIQCKAITIPAKEN